MYIPLDSHLVSICRSFYRRTEKDGIEFSLAEIYLVMMSGVGFCGMKTCIGNLVFSRLQNQLADASFSNSPWGLFTRLVSYLQGRVKVCRQGDQVFQPRPGQEDLKDATVEHIRPYHQGNPRCPGSYTMLLSFPAFGGCVLPTNGTPLELLKLIGTA